MTELKPCPFCGGKAKLIDEGVFNSYYRVQCEYCGASTESEYEDKQSAIRNWNNRVVGNDMTCQYFAPIESMIALCEMVYQFAFNSRPYRGKATLYDGGLSALEQAFFAIKLMGAKFTADGRLPVHELHRIQNELERVRDENETENP